MRIRLSYPVQSSLLLDECWPITMGDIRFEWRVKDGRVSALSASAPVRSTDVPPTVEASRSPGVAAHINLGWSSREPEIEEAIRTLRGLLSLFCYIDIDFDAVEIDWVAENDEENKRIGIHNFSRKKQKANLLHGRRLGYDIVARAAVSLKAASHLEVPLGFLRRATRAIYDDQCIEGFYNLFFFLETLYAPGYSDPRRVKERLWASKDVRDAVARAREPFSRERSLKDAKRLQLLRMNDEQLIDHMVAVRGDLHHHSLSRPGVWHPDKADQFREEAIFLQHVVHGIALQKALALMYEPERNADLMRSAEQANAISKVRVEAVGLINGVRTTLQPFVFSLPRKTIDRLAIHEVHRAFREQFHGGPKNVEVIEYKLLSEDRSQTYAVWERVSSSG